MNEAQKILQEAIGVVELHDRNVKAGPDRNDIDVAQYTEYFQDQLNAFFERVCGHVASMRSDQMAKEIDDRRRKLLHTINANEQSLSKLTAEGQEEIAQALQDSIRTLQEELARLSIVEEQLIGAVT